MYLVSRRSLFLGLLLLVTATAFAAPSGLVVIPTADIAPVGHLCTSIGVTTVPHEASDITLNNQAGVLRGIEAGYDYSFTARQGAGNVKAAITHARGAFAIGVQGLGVARQWYAVLSSNEEVTEPVRLHAGLFDFDRGDISPFFGMEIPVKNTTLMIEGVAGDSEYASLGAYFPITRSFDGVVGGIFGQPGGVQWYFEVGCVLPHPGDTD